MFCSNMQSWLFSQKNAIRFDHTDIVGTILKSPGQQTSHCGPVVDYCLDMFCCLMFVGIHKRRKAPEILNLHLLMLWFTIYSDVFKFCLCFFKA